MNSFDDDNDNDNDNDNALLWYAFLCGVMSERKNVITL